MILKCVSVLLAYNCDITMQNSNGHCALMVAASSG